MSAVINELGRCLLCGGGPLHVRRFCAPAEGGTVSFCELAHQRRIDNGWATTDWLPWDVELERRQSMLRQAAPPSGFGGLGEKGGDICALLECDEPTEPHQLYHSEACRAKAYRLRRKGEM